jgi:gluconolactonase
MNKKIIALLSIGVAAVTCMPCKCAWAGSARELTVTPTPNNTNAPITVRTASGALGSIKRLDPALDALLAKDAVIEKLTKGFDWSEGPVWMPGDYLLFSDVTQNTIFKWDAQSGVSIFLQPSGYTGTEPRGGEPGSNGLTRDKQGRLIACQQGDRRVARWENGKFVAIADHFEGKRFNSPNDVVVKSNGDIYFTDPPYGLLKNLDDPNKEIPFQGVYRVSARDGSVRLLTSEIASPNGLAFSPDEKILMSPAPIPRKRSGWPIP